MTHRTVYYTASSLDGYLVDEDESLSWLLSREIDQAGPLGFDTFILTVGAIAMGAATYRWIMTNHPDEWPYTVPCFVFTHGTPYVPVGRDVRVVNGEVGDIHPRLVKAAGERDIWMCGGGDLAAQYEHAGLLDEMVVMYAPCSLGAGARLLPTRSEWRVVEMAVNGEFVCIRYQHAGQMRTPFER